jgi:hypothetical protein
MRSMATDKRVPARRWWLGVARFCTLCAFTLWLGGLAFFGPIAAPIVFRVSRAHGMGHIAPEMVAFMLTRFGFVMLGCGVLLLLGLAAERALSTPAALWSRRLWWIQGIGSLLMLALAVYLTQVLMPQIVALQPQVLGSNVSPAVQAAFDARHARYSQLATIIVWTGLAAMLAFALRTAVETAE